MRKFLVFITIFIAVFLVLFVLRTDIRDLALEWEKNGLPEETRIPIQSETPLKPAATTSSLPLTGQVNLAVPFSPQAPYADWGLPYQEACEETSALLVDRFYKNQSTTPESVRDEILQIVGWEKKKFGYYMHTTAAETATILKQYFGYKRVDVLYDISIDDMKAHLLAGRPIIVPIDGQLVGNPFYRQPGPAYHMLVVKGFTSDGKFITNDVGTRRGQNYAYDQNIFFNAMHDAPTGGDGWGGLDPSEYIRTGRRAIIVVYPN